MRIRSVARPAVAVVLIGQMMSGSAWAWGRIGHRTAAAVAEGKLTPHARAVVKDLLEPGESLKDASTWADEHRREIKESGPWHYVNVPITEAAYNPKFCQPGGCVVSKIDDFRRILADEKAPRAERQKALRFVVHLIQDLHQPVHVGDRNDRGGNNLQLQFAGQGTNLHALWDSRLIEQHSADEARWIQEIQAIADSKAAETWAQGTPSDWANESLADAKSAYQMVGANRALRPGDKLGPPYQAMALPIVQRRLAQASVRVAAVLNQIFP